MYSSFLLVFCIKLFCYFNLAYISLQCSCSGVGLSDGRGSESDPDIPRVKTLENSIHNNVWKIYKTDVQINSLGTTYLNPYCGNYSVNVNDCSIM